MSNTQISAKGAATIITITQPAQIVTINHSGEYLIELTKPGSEVTVQGVFSVKDSQSVAVTVVIHHKAPHTRAQTTLKGVGRDKSLVRFVGRIIIDPDCGDTQSFLTERILLLSDTARAETVPDLEILTDDVKCSHAASISRIPQEQVFYLMSRGLPQVWAEELIVDGFLGKAST